MIKRALLSVTDKSHIALFAKGLVGCGFEIVSTGGTANAITDQHIPCTTVETVTGFPEMLNGRVKTLHPNIFAGIIADQGDTAHMKTLQKHRIEPFGLVAVNLYNFCGDPSIEQIDVGGPSMIRAAAKNYNSVIVVVDPADYEWIVEQLSDGDILEKDRFNLAAKAFRATANYDTMIANEFEACADEGKLLKDGGKH